MNVPPSDRDPDRDFRMVCLLEALHATRAPELEHVYGDVAAQVAATFCADLANCFIFKPEIESLVAHGTSPTSMGRRQRALGLDRLSLAHGGRAVWTFRTGAPHLAGRANQDPEERRSLVEGLGIRSVATCAIEVGDQRRGVLFVASAEPEAFRERDLRALRAVAGWVGLVMERAQILDELAAAQERRRFEGMNGELARLTTRQQQIAVLVAEGLTNAEIATRLALHEGTVGNHMEQALRRLKLRSRAQLAVWAYRYGIYQPAAEPGAGSDPIRDRRLP